MIFFLSDISNVLFVCARLKHDIETTRNICSRAKNPRKKSSLNPSSNKVQFEGIETQALTCKHGKT